MFIMKQVGHGKFSKYKVGEIMIVEVELKWCFRRKSWRLGRFWIFFWDFYFNSFFSLDVQYWEYRGDRKENNNYGNRIVLKLYTKLLNYDFGDFCFCKFFTRFNRFFLLISMRNKRWSNCDILITMQIFGLWEMLLLKHLH